MQSFFPSQSQIRPFQEEEKTCKLSLVLYGSSLKFVFCRERIVTFLSGLIFSQTNPLQSLSAPSLDGQDYHRDESSEEQRASSINRRGRVGVTGVDGNDRRAETRNTVEEAGDSGASAAVGGGEDFRGVCVEHAVHDVLEESFEGGEDELEVRVAGRREDVDEDARDDGCDCHCAFAADVLDVDGDAGEERARHANG